MKRRARESLTFDLTPLIDAIFLLLIFFMVSTVFRKDESILNLTLPKTQRDPTEVSSQKQDRLTIELSPTQIAANRKILTLQGLRALLKKHNASLPVDLKVDKGVLYERLIKVMEVLKKENFTNLSLITH